LFGKHEEFNREKHEPHERVLTQSRKEFQMDDKTLLQLKQSFACLLASQVHQRLDADNVEQCFQPVRAEGEKRRDETNAEIFREYVDNAN
jgi:hypothetical protein